MLFEEASVGYGKNFSGGTVGGLLISGPPGPLFGAACFDLADFSVGW